MGEPPRTALVMGGSLGGLFAALFLEKHGFQVTILERSSSRLTGKGAGIVLSPATERFFRLHAPYPVSTFSIPTRELRYITTPSSPPIPCKYRISSYNALISGLQQIPSSVRYILKANVVSISETANSVTAFTSSGAQYTASMLVCADGTASRARSLLFGNCSTTEYSGYITWRGVVDLKDKLQHCSTEMNNSILVHLTADGHLLSCPTPITLEHGSSSQTVHTNWLWYRNTPLGEPLNEIMTDKSGRIHERSVPVGQVRPCMTARLQRDAASLPEPFRSIIKHTPQPFVQAIYDVETSRMVSGRVCLLGDAAFTARPHTAIGTAKAAEDAWQLANAVAELGVVDGLKKYEQKQLLVGKECVRRAREVGVQLQSGKWKVTRKLAFGLFEEGDSEVYE